MTRKMIRIIAIVLVALLGLVSVVAVAIDAISYSARAEAATPLDQYTLNMVVLDELDAIRVDQSLVYTNRTGQKLSQVLFNLYPNAYRRQVTVPFESETMQSAYPNGFTPGGADFFLIEVNGEAADWGVQGSAEAFLRVDAELDPGASCTFQFGYELLLPNCLGNLGVTKSGYQLNGFYPMVAPWDDYLEEFSVANVLAVGGSLMADPADYRATIDAPSGTVVAAPGTLTSETDGTRVRWTIEASGVRQFGMELSTRYRRFERESASGKRIVALTTDGGAANRALDTAALALDYYESVLGDYPFNTLVLAQVDHVSGARMNSGMVMLDDGLLGLGQRGELEHQIALNIAKQWFFEKVSHNPSREAWLSEATSAYMALRYYGHVYGNDRFLQELNARALPALKLTMPGGVKVDSETIRFASVNDYEIIVQDRGMATMYELSLMLGEDGLNDAMKRYIEANAGKQASIEDFANALTEVAGEDMGKALVHLLQNIEEYATETMDWYD